MCSDTPRLEDLLASSDPHQIRQGLDLIRAEVARRGSEDARPLFALVASLFYIDPLDHPEMGSILNEAISLAIGFGDCIIPQLVTDLDQGDLKAQMAAAAALGRFGADAIDPLIEKFNSTKDAGTRAFVIYALGKIRSPQVVKAADLVLTGAESADLELRDTAVRAMGRLAEVVPPSELPPETARSFYHLLRQNLAYPNKGVKAKALRSLGKLAAAGHLNDRQCEKLTAIAVNLLGEDGQFEWDRTYVVRKEAAEALKHFQLKSRRAHG